MLKFARRRARSSEREPVKCLLGGAGRPRASSAERAPAASPAPSAALTPSQPPSRVASRAASVATVPRASVLFPPGPTDLPPAHSAVPTPPAAPDCSPRKLAVKPTFGPMTGTVSQLAGRLEEISLGLGRVQIGSPETAVSTPPVLPRKPKLVDTTRLPVQFWRGELLDQSTESGYGTDSSDNNSLKSGASTAPAEASPPPLPKRKPRRRVQFDSYVLLIQSLKERDLKGILSTIFNVSAEALCTEDVIYHFHTAILRQDYEVCELLVRGGAEVNTFDHWGWSALHCACSLGRLDMIKLLLQNGAAVLARTHHSSQTATQLVPLDNPAHTQCLAYLRYCTPSSLYHS